MTITYIPPKQNEKFDMSGMVQLLMGLSSTKQQKEVMELQKKQFALKERAFGLEAGLVSAQTQATISKTAEQRVTAPYRGLKAEADWWTSVTEGQIAELNRQIKARGALPEAVAKAETEKLTLKTYKDLLKSSDPERRDIAVNALTNFSISKMQGKELRETKGALDLLSKKYQADTFTLKKSTAEANQKFRDTQTFVNLHYGDFADLMKQNMGEDAFEDSKMRGTDAITGQTRRRTPMRTGVNVPLTKGKVKIGGPGTEPGPPMTFRTAYEAWLKNDILDEDMWHDWSEVLMDIGLRYDPSTKSLVPQNSLGAPTNQESLEETLRQGLGK